MVDGGYKHEDGLPLDKQNSANTSTYLSQVKRWEKLKDKRALITDEMLEEFAERSKHASRDALETVFLDWLAVGRYTGFRASEWAQSRKYTYDLIDDDARRGSRAMVDGDWLFYDERGYLLDKKEAYSHRVFRVDICWRVQKNKMNGEIISFWRDDGNPAWCPVRAAWRICLRARRMNIPDGEPLAQYRDSTYGRRAFVHTQAVENYMRAVAHKTTGIQNTAIINKMYGMHSIRVTACNELARLHVSDSFIQRRLRWKSNTFLEYLRNNIHVAQRHKLSLNIATSHHDTELQENLLPRAHRQLANRQAVAAS